MATKKTDGKRSQKVAEALRGELMNMLLAGEVHDPGLAQATVSAVALTDDLRLAKVYVRTLELETGAAAQRQLLAALERAKGFLRRELAQRLQLRHAPELRFYYDESIDRGREIEALLRELQAPTVDARGSAERDVEGRGSAAEQDVERRGSAAEQDVEGRGSAAERRDGDGRDEG